MMRRCGVQPDRNPAALVLTTRHVPEGGDPGPTIWMALEVTMDRRTERRLSQSFGAVAETYDRVRPRYFLPLLDRAQEILGLGSTAEVLDIGAGTGRLTRELVSRFSRVYAVEPDDDMRRLLNAGVVLAGTAEAIPLADHSVDTVFAGEAFHWFPTPGALAEIARVLRPRAGFVLISTHWWETDPELPESVEALLREAYERTAEQRPPPWETAFDGSPFEPLQSERFEEEITVDRDRLLALYSTTSAIAALPQNHRTALLAEARKQLAGPYRLPIKHRLSFTRLV
jgi:ubiquinone/menaquinone biosynthesis C-methylase UbiE